MFNFVDCISSILQLAYQPVHLMLHLIGSLITCLTGEELWSNLINSSGLLPGGFVIFHLFLTSLLVCKLAWIFEENLNKNVDGSISVYQSVHLHFTMFIALLTNSISLSLYLSLSV